MNNIKELRIDAYNYPFFASHLIIKKSGYVEVIKDNNVRQTKVRTLKKFFDDLEGALLLDFKMISQYKESKNYYHISVLYDDDTEESHFYRDNLHMNNQINIRSVLMKYIDPLFLIDVVLSEEEI